MMAIIEKNRIRVRAFQKIRNLRANGYIVIKISDLMSAIGFTLTMIFFICALAGFNATEFNG